VVLAALVLTDLGQSAVVMISEVVPLLLLWMRTVGVLLLLWLLEVVMTGEAVKL